MNKSEILNLIIERLTLDSGLQLHAAKTAHEASTHEENIPDNKYETLALEASYLAQGQANRAQDIKRALTAYKQLELQNFDADTKVALTALVTLVADDAETRIVFIGPREGGMKIADSQCKTEVLVITPASPLGGELIGKSVGDQIKIGTGNRFKFFEISDVC